MPLYINTTNPWCLQIVVLLNASNNASDLSNFPNATYYNLTGILPNETSANPYTVLIPEGHIVRPGTMIGVIPFGE